MMTYNKTDDEVRGSGQYKTVSTECGMTVARNGACFSRKTEATYKGFRVDGVGDE